MSLPVCFFCFALSVTHAQDILELPPPKADARIAYAAGDHRFGDLRVPTGRGSHPVVILIHGGYWRARYDLEHLGHLADALRRDGFATWSLEYRRIGNDGGAWPGTFDDIRLGAAHLEQLARTHSLDRKRVIVMGHSAGGHLALWLAAQKAIPLRGVVSLAGVADLRRAWELKLSRSVVGELLGGPPEQFPDRYAQASPIELLPLRVPQVILHGERDDIVPLEISRRYAEAAAKKGDRAKLVTLPDTGHFEVIDPRARQYSSVRDAIRDLLKR